MSQIGTRKRPAPGASPVEKLSTNTFAQQNGTAVSQNRGTNLMATDQYLQWPQQTQSSYTDPMDSPNLDFYGGISDTQGTSAGNAGPVARRSLGQQPVSRSNYSDTGNDNWPLLADNHGQTTDAGWMDEDDDLERRAEIAKRETQAKRKQIPPFVQKLSR